ncbi:hypothetical protein QWE_00080 [Agrobacterium albertimagni AOL15]|uniref:Uncharacterized protein n=1 Tax=Agrobacterium albertimagni AOL15 TaxID=1156935 RepID=K2QC89_9HYPH|nr:hypothetical protein QWE_00080 [Agrobacterium albertimagni AOL15]
MSALPFAIAGVRPLTLVFVWPNNTFVPAKSIASLLLLRSLASRPVFEGIKFGDRLDLVVIKLVARQDAELVSGPEKRDRNHQGADECESMTLSERKNPVPIEKRPSGAGRSRSMAQRTRDGRDHRLRRSPKRAELASGPRERVDRRRSGLGYQDAIDEGRDWLPSEDREVFRRRSPT